MPNRLSGETSPYLLQHAGNPVDWHPWDSEALALARSENKPILLSIGYSACHWCHVMAHECFEDADVAAAMNRHFVNIKVDREERPDLDQIYQTALYMLTRRPGGWPLTLFLTPEQKPFFGGTYFPRSARQGLPGFLDLLPRVAEAYHERGDEIERQSVSLLQAFANSLPSAEQAYAGFSQRPLDLALAGLQEQFDAADGGFGAAPKFLHPTKLEFCLRRHFTTGDTQALHMATHTLRRMAEGGLRDQLGGGFYRYSTDAHWSIPHFEKMLYDNGPLLSLYADAWLASGEPLFSQAAEETAAWIMREMEQPEGGYYSSLDADSENEEGRFYVWDRDQVAGILDHDEYAVLAPRYGLTGDPNFEGRHWHLEIARPLAEISRAVGIDEDAALQRLASARAKLLAARALRVRPGRDEKILPAWNGLAIKGMAHAGSILGRDDWIHSAARATDFVRAALWRDGHLLASFKDGRAHLNGYLDDHAFMLDGVLELMQAQFRPSDLEFAIALADALLEHFEDRESGGFFFTSHDHEKLIHRPKPGIDNVMPSGNGMAAQALQWLGYLTGRFHYLEAAERALALFYPHACRNAASCCSFLAGVEQSLAPPVLVLLHGPATTVREWKSALRSRAPLALVFAPPPELNVPLPGLNWAAKAEHTAGARVCLGTRCLPEIADLRELLRVCEVRDNTSS